MKLVLVLVLLLGCSALSCARRAPPTSASAEAEGTPAPVTGMPGCTAQKVLLDNGISVYVVQCPESTGLREKRPSGRSYVNYYTSSVTAPVEHSGCLLLPESPRPAEAGFEFYSLKCPLPPTP